MKKQVFQIEAPRRRDPYARELLDRDGPYRPRRVKSAVEWRRRPKHTGKGQEWMQ